MTESDIYSLQCPACLCALTGVKCVLDHSGAVLEGVIKCPCCATHFPVIDYVAIFLTAGDARNLLSEERYARYLELSKVGNGDAIDGITGKAMCSSKNWSEQFTSYFDTLRINFEHDGFYGEKAFWNFCGLGPEDICEKNVCIYCGGSGREIYHINNIHPKKTFLIDIGEHIFSIPQIISNNMRDTILILSDFYEKTIRENSIDISICDHALQHIENNKKAFAHIVDRTIDGGVISICVYSHENNFLMTRFVEPSKPFLRALGLKRLRHLSAFAAGILFALHKAYSGMAFFSRNLAEKLPYFELFSLWGKEGFGKFHEACFDLMHAPVSHHFKKRELEAMARENRLEHVSITMSNKTMWTLVGRKPA